MFCLRFQICNHPLAPLFETLAACKSWLEKGQTTAGGSDMLILLAKHSPKQARICGV
jgi:hypothetical protein